MSEMVHQITPIESDLGDLLRKTFNNDKLAGTDYIKVDGVTMPACYTKFIDAIENFQVRDDDVWVCSFPKTGTTWTQEMVWCIANDLDFEKAKVSLNDRFPFLEVSGIFEFPEAMQQNLDFEIPESAVNSVNFVENLPSPRFIKTHLPFNLLPRQLKTGEKKPKIVYVVRNAKDTCISYFHHSKLLNGFDGSFKEFCTLFTKDALRYAPFWTHALGYRKKRIDENVLFIKYEDMRKDLPWVIRKTGKFLGKNLTTDQVSALAEHLSFASMKTNPAVNNEEMIALRSAFTNSEEDGKFIRSGTVDQWKTDMSPECIEQFDNWTRDRLRGTRLYF